MDSVTVCKNCKHSVSGFKLPYISDKWDWKHYQKKRGSERGTRQIKCFSCECEKPEPFVPNAGHLNSNHLKEGKRYHAESITIIDADFLVVNSYKGIHTIEIEGEIDYLMGASEVKEDE